MYGFSVRTAVFPILHLLSAALAHRVPQQRLCGGERSGNQSVYVKQPMHRFFQQQDVGFQLQDFIRIQPHVVFHQLVPLLVFQNQQFR
jgi:hypothetical protein